MRIHAPITRLRLSPLRWDDLAVSTTLVVMCRLRCAGASHGGLAGRGRLGGLGCLCGLGLGRLCSSLRGRVSSAVRVASRSASFRLQSCATAATTLHGGGVLKSQEARAVGDIVVGAGPVRVTLVE